jgi:hypothetical protein
MEMLFCLTIPPVCDLVLVNYSNQGCINRTLPPGYLEVRESAAEGASRETLKEACADATLGPAIATASSHLLTRIVAGSWVGSWAVAVQSSRRLPHLHQDAEGHQEDTVEPGLAACCFPQPRSVQSSSARRQLVVL